MSAEMLLLGIPIAGLSIAVAQLSIATVGLILQNVEFRKHRQKERAKN